MKIRLKISLHYFLGIAATFATLTALSISLKAEEGTPEKTAETKTSASAAATTNATATSSATASAGSATSTATTSPEARPTSALPKKKAKKAAVAENAKLPTKLPPYKGPKRIAIDFEKDSGTHQTTVVARHPLPLEKAMDDEKAAKETLRMGHETKAKGLAITLPLNKLNSRDLPGAVAIAKPAPNDEPVSVLETVETSMAPLADEKKILQKPTDEFSDRFLETQKTKNLNLKVRQVSRGNTTAQVADHVDPAVAKVDSPVKVEKKLEAGLSPTLTAEPQPAPIDPSNPVLDSASVTGTTVLNAPLVNTSTPIEPVQTIATQPEPLAEKLAEPPKIVASERRASHGSNLDLTNSRVYLRGGYLNAPYSELESRLKNGASSMGAGIGYALEKDLEVRISTDVSHGMDQSVAVENIRMITVRGELARFFSVGDISLFAAGGIGYASYNVLSVRSVKGDAITIKRHANDSALALIPAGGARVELTKAIAFEVEFDYLGLVGGAHSASVGGLEANAMLGFKF
jgi:hypothetical protein